MEQIWAEAAGPSYHSAPPCSSISKNTAVFYAGDTKTGMIQAYLDKYTGSMVCSKLLYKEALLFPGNSFSDNRIIDNA